MREFDSVILCMRGLGTALCAIHGFDAIKAVHSNRVPKFFLVVPEYPATLYEDLLTAYPHIEVISTGPTQRLSAVRRFARLLVQRNLVITGPTMNGNPMLVRLLAFLLSRRGGVYAGFETNRSARAMQDYTVPLTPTQNVFDTMALLIGKIFNVHQDVPVCFQFRDDTNTMLRYGIVAGKYILVHPFAGSPMRELSQERLVRILHKISALYPDYKLVISGAEKDTHAADVLYASANMNDTVINVTGKCSIQEMATLITHAVAYMGVDTGVTHLASVLCVPSVLLGNNSNPYWLPTYSDTTTILTADEHCTCDGLKGGGCQVLEGGQPRYRCLAEVSDEAILGALQRKVEEHFMLVGA